MLNSIGLENPGIEVFIKERLPLLVKYGVPLIVSISSEDNVGEFIALAKALDKIKSVAAIELNISCPNIRPQAAGLKLQAKSFQPAACSLQPVAQSRLISQDPNSTYAAVKSVRKVTDKTLITKLSPNVTDIAEIAQAAEKAGSDAVALVNTFVGMGIDIEKRAPKLATVTGGLSGPAIRPVAVRMVWQVFQKIKIPIIGMGGIMDSASALEFIIAGASAVAVGTANFVNPKATAEIISGIKKYLTQNKLKDIKSLTGSLITLRLRAGNV
jgi:dihydroorotate dehydrogenase (NAD+) catalytic subunit